MKRRPLEFWQSFSDLALGLLAVIILIMVLLLDIANAETKKLEGERKKFAKELMFIVKKSFEIIENQDKVVNWLNNVFEVEGCGLRLEKGKLVNKDASSKTQLYSLGAVNLQKNAQEELKKCSKNFEILSVCLGNSDSSKSNCKSLINKSGLTKFSDEKVLSQYRNGVESLVLQGNTDKIPIKSRFIQPIYGINTQSSHGLKFTPQVFVNNAFLGAERARQSLGHLLFLMQDKGENLDQPLELLMSKVSIETPSFGRYLAGPVESREKGCNDNFDCEDARNLSLKIRWKTESLRKPFSLLQKEFCNIFAQEGSLLDKAVKTLDEKSQKQYDELCKQP